MQRPEIYFVLCYPQDLRNIGSVIRAVANFDLAGLRIVGRTLDEFDPQLMFGFSSGSVESAPPTWHATLAEAVADCGRVLATSRREHDPDSPPEWPASGLARRLSPNERVAVVFGTEASGMTGAEIARCDAVVQIPTSERFPSMNLSHAVACLAYELNRPEPETVGPALSQVEAPRAEASARDGFFDHIRGVCEEIAYPRGRTPDNFTRRFRRLMTRANPDPSELHMVAGLFSELRRLTALLKDHPKVG